MRGMKCKKARTEDAWEDYCSQICHNLCYQYISVSVSNLESTFNFTHTFKMHMIHLFGFHAHK